MQPKASAPRPFNLARRAGLLALCGGAVLVLSACGGSDDHDHGPGGPSAAAGFYDGVTSSNRAIHWVVLETGRYYALYGPLGQPSSTVIEGLIIGDGLATGRNFSSNALTDINFTGQTLTTGTLAAQFEFRTLFDGTVTYSGNSSGTFQSDYSFTYENAPSLASTAGSYTGQLATGTAVTATNFVVSASGAIDAAVAGTCDIAGQLGLHLAGGNVYDVSLTYGPACGTSSGITVTGHAKLDSKSLYIVTATSTFGNVALLLGTKP